MRPALGSDTRSRNGRDLGLEAPGTRPFDCCRRIEGRSGKRSDGLRGAALLRGTRGMPATDLDVLTEVIDKVGQIAVELGDELESPEIQPAAGPWRSGRSKHWTLSSPGRTTDHKKAQRSPAAHDY